MTVRWDGHDESLVMLGGLVVLTLVVLLMAFVIAHIRTDSRLKAAAISGQETPGIESPSP